MKEQQFATDVKNVDLTVQQNDDEVRVEAQEDGQRQILENLTDNAIKYIPENGQVTVGSHREGDNTAIFVQDTRIGIPEKMPP